MYVSADTSEAHHNCLLWAVQVLCHPVSKPCVSSSAIYRGQHRAWILKGVMTQSDGDPILGTNVSDWFKSAAEVSLFKRSLSA